jgi:voltage-gated potassium channel
MEIMTNRYIKYVKGFHFFFKGIAKRGREIAISVILLVILTTILSLLLYWIERSAQPDVYSSYWHNLLWSFTTYFDDHPDHVIIHDPITRAGKMMWAMLGLMKIALFAVPTGLIANGFEEAMEEDKHEEQLQDNCRRLSAAFSRKLARHINEYRHKKGESGDFYLVRKYRSLASLQVTYHLDTKDVLDACEAFPEYRLANLATIQTEAENPIDRIVVLHGMNYLYSVQGQTTRPYGYYINRQSKVTIVVTSAHTEISTEWFGFYLSMFGGFNFICRNQCQDPENTHSYYNMEEHSEDADMQLFYNDLKLLSQGDDHWNVYLLHRVTNITKVGNHINFSATMSEGQEPTVMDQPTYEALKQRIVDMFGDYGFQFSTTDFTRFPLQANNVAYRLRRDGVHCNAFTMRIGTHLMAKHTYRDLMTYRMAESIQAVLTPETGMREEDYMALCKKK